MSLTNKALAAAAAGALALVLPIFTYQRESSATATMEEQEQRNAGAFATILGEFRTNIGDMLFVKTERYLDYGIAYAPHADVEELPMSDQPSGDGHDDHDDAGHGHEDHDHDGDGKQDHAPEEHDNHAGHEPEDHDHDGDGKQDHAPEDHDHAAHEGHDHASHDDHDHEGHDHGEHAGVPTLIRTLDMDFRGFVGRMEREVKPYRDPSEAHKHSIGDELLPWYRIASLSDPHNVRTYVIGSWWLKTMKTQEQRQEALRFLEEGIRNNPESYALYLMKGYILKEDNDTTAARAAFDKSAELAVKVRPPDGKTTADWDETDEDQTAAAISMSVYLVRDDEGTASARARVDRFRSHFPSPSFIDRLDVRLKE